MPLKLNEKIEIIELFEDFVRSSREVELNRRHPQLVPITHGIAAALNTLFNQTGIVIKIH